jgi:hypothetical protein
LDVVITGKSQVSTTYCLTNGSLNAGILTFVLAQARTGFRSTDIVINRLIRGVIQTGVFASIFSLGNLIAFLTSPTTNLCGMFAIPIGRIYTNVRLQF